VTRPPLAALRTPILLLAVVSAVSAAGVLWSRHLDADARAVLQREQTAMNAARARAQQAGREERLIALHLDAYQALVARGLVGGENRLAWIEAAHLANRDARLYGLTYTLSPRTAAPAALAGDLPLRQTRMTIKLPLLVETDLPRFLDGLRARAPGVFRVDRCRLTRIADTPPQPANRPELEAECELLWFTVSADDKEAR
jgi:hypothetical protein